MLYRSYRGPQIWVYQSKCPPPHKKVIITRSYPSQSGCCPLPHRTCVLTLWHCQHSSQCSQQSPGSYKNPCWSRLSPPCLCVWQTKRQLWATLTRHGSIKQTSVKKRTNPWQYEGVSFVFLVLYSTSHFCQAAKLNTLLAKRVWIGFVFELHLDVMGSLTLTFGCGK